MIRLLLALRQLRLRATPRLEERGAVEAYLRAKGAFGITHAPFFSLARAVSLAVVLVLVLSVSVSSYAYASDAVLPDTVLYPVRQALEVVETKFAVTPAQKEKVHEKIMERRVKEVKKLEELKRPVPVKLKKLVEERVATKARALRIIERQERIQERARTEERNSTVEFVTTTSKIRHLKLQEEDRGKNRKGSEEFISDMVTSTVTGELRLLPRIKEKQHLERLKERLKKHRQDRKR